jgi:site-specific DNA-cytosine methylase
MKISTQGTFFKMNHTVEHMYDDITTQMHMGTPRCRPHMFVAGFVCCPYSMANAQRNSFSSINALFWEQCESDRLISM